jgi:hypothetical protein
MAPACSAPPPSGEYDRARSAWAEIVSSRPQSPAEDPRADEVLALLRQVRPGSADSAAAAELRERIEAARRDAADERARRDQLAARAAAPPPATAPLAAAPGGAAAAPRPPGVGGGGAPPIEVAAPPLPPGMKLEDFRAAYGACFEDAGPATVTGPDGGPRAGGVWLMKDDPRCRAAHPGLVGQVAVFAGGALLGVSPRAELKRVETRREVELAPLPDGGTGMRVDGGVVPLPPGATVLPGGAAPSPDAGSAR